MGKQSYLFLSMSLPMVGSSCLLVCFARARFRWFAFLFCVSNDIVKYKLLKGGILGRDMGGKGNMSLVLQILDSAGDQQDNYTIDH